MLKKFVFSLMIVGVIGAIASANLIANLKIEKINGEIWAGDVTKADVKLGDVVTLGVYCTINSGSDQTLLAGAMRFTSTETGTVWGNMSDPTVSWPLKTLGSSQNYPDGNPDLEWGGTYPATTSATYYYFADTTAHAGGAGPYPIGTITWTCTSPGVAGDQTVLQAVPYASCKSPFAQNYSYNDPAAHTNTAGGFVTGQGVTLSTPIPEPATLALLGMGALALLAIWRRK